jgi:hypothetical protein
MKKKLLHVLIIVIPLITNAQQETFNFKGIVFEFKKPIEGVHIYNISNLTGTSTNENGRFNIMVSVNDTLLVSHVKYRNKKVIITKEYLEQDSLNIISIEEMTNYLETVTLKT